MAYNKITWVNGGTPAINATNLNSMIDGTEQNNLFNLLLSNDKYKVTEFDTPSAGDITETIKLKSDNSTYATIITEFDTPSAGDITVTLNCSALGLSNKVITEFDTPSAGDITETGGAV